jgi:protease I
MSKVKDKVRSTEHDSVDELTLDDANEMSFPASDPIAPSNITRIEVPPDMAPASSDHQNSTAARGDTETDKNREASEHVRKPI